MIQHRCLENELNYLATKQKQKLITGRSKFRTPV